MTDYCFAQALVPTYLLYLNIILFYSAWLALIRMNVTFFVVLYYIINLV